jgi:hypothetical protein
MANWTNGRYLLVAGHSQHAANGGCAHLETPAAAATTTTPIAMAPDDLSGVSSGPLGPGGAFQVR